MISNLTPDFCFAVIEKNTFISVVLEDDADCMQMTKPRRNSSLPPSVRIACTDTQTSSSTGLNLSEDKSTVCDSSDANSSEESDSDGQGLHSCESTPVSTPTDTTPKSWMPSGSMPSLADMLPEASSRPCPVNGCVSPLRSRLRAHARAFAPRALTTGHSLTSSYGSCCWTQQPASCLFVQRCSSIIDAMRQALISTRHVSGVEVRMGDLCWSVAVQLHKDVLPDDAFDSAKAALLEGAFRSENVYVLGYQCGPFVTTPFGFTAFICDVKDNDAACWDMFATGYCRREGRCPWEHPDRRARVSVIIKRVADI